MNSSESFSYTSEGISHLKFLLSKRLFMHLPTHSELLHRYAPLPFFLPVLSIEKLSSGPFTTRMSSRLSFICRQARHIRKGAFFSVAITYSRSPRSSSNTLSSIISSRSSKAGSSCAALSSAFLLSTNCENGRTSIFQPVSLAARRAF